MRAKEVTEGLSDHDVAIWHAVECLQKLDRGASDQLPRQQTTFAPQMGRCERVMSVASYNRLVYTSLGDGTYYQTGGAPFVAVGSGAVLGASLAASGLIAMGTVVGNSRRRAAAQDAAQVQWRVVEQGHLYVSTHGFYLHTAYGLNPWPFDCVTSAEMIAPGCMLLSGNGAEGPVQWVVNSIQSEFLFTQWARRVHPGHPQLVSHSWLPRGWVQRVQQSRFELPSFGVRQVEGR